MVTIARCRKSGQFYRLRLLNASRFGVILSEGRNWQQILYYTQYVQEKDEDLVDSLTLFSKISMCICNIVGLNASTWKTAKRPEQCQMQWL